jgi:hypothetical protein
MERKHGIVHLNRIESYPYAIRRASVHLISARLILVCAGLCQEVEARSQRKTTHVCIIASVRVKGIFLERMLMGCIDLSHYMCRRSTPALSARQHWSLLRKRVGSAPPRPAPPCPPPSAFVPPRKYNEHNRVHDGEEDLRAFVVQSLHFPRTC